jgi:colanic acid/amylovoran biosynthesis glycosyltransferase
MSRTTRLAYVCHVFPHLTQTFVYREVAELRRTGIELTVFSMKPPQTATLSEESRYLVADTVYLPPVGSAAMLLSQLFWLVRAPGRYLGALSLVARGRYRYDNSLKLWARGLVEYARGTHLARLLTQEGGYCHIHAQFADGACTTALVASALTGIGFSFRSHTSPNPQLIEEKLRRAQFVVSASLYDKRVLIQWCGEPLSRKIHVNRLGVPLDFGFDIVDSGLEGPAAIQNPKPKIQSPLVLSVGTLCAKKGFEYVVRACRRLADRGIAFECVVVGDGPDRGRLEALVRFLDLGGRVTLAPYMPQEELRGLFQRAAVFTLPCIFPLDGNVDVIPLVIQEAMAMGRPVVSTPISGIPELIEDGVNGLLAPEKDDEALAEALAALLTDAQLAARLGAAGRETVRSRFDVAVNAGELAAILRREVPELTGEEAPSPAARPLRPSRLTTHD